MGAATQPSLTTSSTLTWQFACLPTAVLVADPHRVLSLFQPAGFIHYPGFQRLQVGNHFLPDRSPHGFIAPRTTRHQLLQCLRVHVQAGRHGFDRFALTGHQQARHVMRGGSTAFAPPQARDQRGNEVGKLRHTAFPKPGIPFRARQVAPEGFAVSIDT